MNFMNEYGLLIAVALPVLAIVGIQVFLLIGGERGTGLLPGFNRYPSLEVGKASAIVTPVPVVELVETAKAVATVEPSNDEVERIAA